MMEQVIRAWHIGEHGAIYAGRCTDEEMKQFVREVRGYELANRCIAACFEEVNQDEMDRERDYVGDYRKLRRTTYRKEAEAWGTDLPCQIHAPYL